MPCKKEEDNSQDSMARMRYCARSGDYSSQSEYMELKELIAECTAYDYKEALEEKKPKSWLKSVSAFANTLGGSLFFGVDNDGNVKGLDEIQHVTETISMKIRDYMDPLPDVEMIPLEQEGKHVLQLKVKEGLYTPYYYVGDGQRVSRVCTAHAGMVWRKVMPSMMRSSRGISFCCSVRQ